MQISLLTKGSVKPVLKTLEMVNVNIMNFLLFRFVWPPLCSSPRVDLLPACDDNLALCSELISAGRRFLVSLRRSCSQHALLGSLAELALITGPPRAAVVNFQIHLGASSCGFMLVLCL